MDAVHGDDSSDIVLRTVIGTDVGDEVSAGGFANECDAVRIYLINRSIVLDPSYSFFNVVGIGRKFMVRREAIVDAEPGEVGVGEWLEQIGDVLPLVARDPAATMYQDHRRKGTSAIWDVRVEGEIRSVDKVIDDVGEVGGSDTSSQR